MRTNDIQLTRSRICAAIAVAVAADILQLPLTIAFVFGGAGWIATVIIDIIVFFIIRRLIGYHWLLLPSVVLECVPFLDAFPTWTASVVIVAWRKRSTLTARPAVKVFDRDASVIDVDVEVIPEGSDQRKN